MSYGARRQVYCKTWLLVNNPRPGTLDITLKRAILHGGSFQFLFKEDHVKVHILTAAFWDFPKWMSWSISLVYIIL